MSEYAPDRAATRRVRKEPDERRDQILATARELFSRRPYATVSNTEIAMAAGVSRGLLNHYFGTRRELYLAAVRQMLSIPRNPAPEFAEDVPVEARVSQSLDAWLTLLERNRETWIAALDLTSSGGDADLEAILEEARDAAVDQMTEVIGLSPSSRAHPRVRSAFRGYSAMAESVSREWLKHGRLTRSQVHLLLREVLLNLLQRVLPELADAERGAPGRFGGARARSNT